MDPEGAGLSCSGGDRICWKVEGEARVELTSQGSICVLAGQLPGERSRVPAGRGLLVWAGTPGAGLCGTEEGITSLGRGGHSTPDGKPLVP